MMFGDIQRRTVGRVFIRWSCALMGRLLRFGALLLMSLVTVQAASAQNNRMPPDPTGLQLTRTELEQLLAEYDQTATSSVYSSQLRQRALKEAELIRARLEEGDLRIGDRIALVVEGQTQLSDTFNVVAGRVIVLPDIGSISVAGVLRSELQSHMTSAIGRYIRDPVVHARSLVRLEILGAIGRPGFYTVPSDMLLSDALMLAGGPQGNARIEGTRIDRAGEVIWAAEDLREALIEGRTLDQLSVRAGDTLIVPQQSSRFASIRNGVVFVSGITSIVVILKQLGVF